MHRTMLRQPWLIALGAALAIAAMGTAYAAPGEAPTDEEALSRAIAFETAIALVSTAPSVYRVIIFIISSLVVTVGVWGNVG